jgi:hypothetical protein
MSLLTAKVRRRTGRKREIQIGKNIHARLYSSNTGDYLFTAELVNYTVVRNALPGHAMKACGEGELELHVLFASALHNR